MRNEFYMLVITQASQALLIRMRNIVRHTSNRITVITTQASGSEGPPAAKDTAVMAEISTYSLIKMHQALPVRHINYLLARSQRAR